MKSRMRKLGALAVLGTTMALFLVACGKKEETELIAFYESTQNLSFYSAYPEYTYKQATFDLETLELYSDGTYCLTATDLSYSGTLTFSDDGTHEEIPRGAVATRYYGTFTEMESDGIANITLAAPTQIVMNNSFSAGASAIGYVNTADWTDTMSTAVSEDGTPVTAEDYLAAKAFPETSILVDTSTGIFDYINLGAQE